MRDPIACLECGQLYGYRTLSAGETATCVRCGAVLYQGRRGMVERALALTATGLLLFGLTNAFPMLALRAQGSAVEMRLFDASIAFWREGFPAVAVLLFLSTIAFPLLELAALLVVLLTLRLDLPRSGAIVLYRVLREIRPWSMLEVFMLGVLVSVVKLGDLATLSLGVAFWTFCALIVTLTAIRAVLDPLTIWRRLGREPAT
jgi:paraquat-inducible protein A